MGQLSDLVYERLDEKGWSVRELGRRSDVPQATLHKILTIEGTKPHVETVEAMARALGLSPKLLMEAVAVDAGYVTTKATLSDGTQILMAGIKNLTKAQQDQVSALVESMLKS